MESVAISTSFSYNTEDVKSELEIVSQTISKWPKWKIQSCETEETSRKMSCVIRQKSHSV